MAAPVIEAVIFDWGGTLTPWHDVDFVAESRALARAVRHPGGPDDLGDPVDPAAHDPAAHDPAAHDPAAHDPAAHDPVAEQLARAVQTVWRRSVDTHSSATLADVFTEAGLAYDESLLVDYRAFWAPHSRTDPDALPLLSRLRSDGLGIGVLSNTVWPRTWHEEIFERDGILGLIDGAVYSSEIAWAKPAPDAFLAAMTAVGVQDPEACVFVGDRLFDDIWGAAQVGMRTIHVPHSDIPAVQLGHSLGTPDAVVDRLAHVHDVVSAWRVAG